MFNHELYYLPVFEQYVSKLSVTIQAIPEGSNEGSNLSPPAIVLNLELNSGFSRSSLTC